MTEPLVSILVPTYNGERFLRIALRSALEQSYKNIEVVIGDDASTDRTPEIIAAVAATDPRVRVIRRETNVGGFQNPRLLLTEARGEYVKFLLHDDVLATDCVRTLVRGMQAAPEATMAFSRRNVINEEGRPVSGGELAPLQAGAGLLDGRELGNACLEGGTNLVGELTTVLFRRDDVDLAHLWQVDGRRLEVLGDLSLWLRLLARGPAFYSPQALSRFRVHSTQSSQDPRLIARGVLDWPRLIDWAVGEGFLADVAQQRRAFGRVLHGATARVMQLVDGPACGPALEAAFLATARLAELAPTTTGGQATGGDGPLPERAHGAALGRLFGQELDVWFRSFPVAVARVEADEAEVRSVVQAFRDVRDAGVATRFVLAVEPAGLEPLARLLADADATGLDVELVPADEPANLVAEGWLAVAPRGSLWHEGRADGVWQFDPPRIRAVGSSSVGA